MLRACLKARVYWLRMDDGAQECIQLYEPLIIFDTNKDDFRARYMLSLLHSLSGCLAAPFV